jgi:hypothetical protein
MDDFDRPLTDLDVEAITRVMDAIRSGQVCYESGAWLVTVDPERLATPESRGKLWQTVERLVREES